MKEKILIINNTIGLIILCVMIIAIVSVFNTEKALLYLKTTNTNISDYSSEMIMSELYLPFAIVGFAVSAGLAISLLACSKFMLVFYGFNTILQIINFAIHNKYYKEFDKLHVIKLKSIEVIILFIFVLGVLMLLNIKYKTFKKRI